MGTDRRPGRPPLNRDDPAVRVTISLPSKQFDVLCAEALRHDVSIPEAVRRELYGQTRLLKPMTPKP